MYKFNRSTLCKIIEMFAYPVILINVFCLFHDDMEAWVNVGGKFSKPKRVDNCVKQRDINAPTTFCHIF